jgi:hypothetical protein
MQRLERKLNVMFPIGTINMLIEKKEERTGGESNTD